MKKTFDDYIIQILLLLAASAVLVGYIMKGLE